MTVIVDGLEWVTGDPDSDDHMGPDPHEFNLEPVIRGLLGQDKVFLDVGAHVGHWAVRLADQASKVIAVEASPETAEVLRKNVELNHLTNVSVVELAAWDRTTLLRLEDPLGRTRGGSTRTLPLSNSLSGSGVLAAPLDDLWLFHDQPLHLVKLDVEGADLHALRGMSRMLRHWRPVLFIERHDMQGYYKIEDLYELLSSLGYRWRDAPVYMGAQYLICEVV